MTFRITVPRVAPVSRQLFLLSFLAAALLSGCASAPDGRLAGELRTVVAGRSGTAWPASPDDLHLDASGVLTEEDALRLAFLGNARFRAELAELGIADAALRQAVALPNPRLFASVRVPNSSGQANNVEFGLSEDLLEILLQPGRRRLARSDFARTRDEVAARLLSLANAVRERYVLAVAAGETAQLQRRMADAERLSRELSARFHGAGNLSDAAFASAQSRAAGVELAALQAAGEAALARAELERVISGSGGVIAPGPWSLPDRLPELPSGEPAADEVRHEALAGRLDLASARSSVAALEEALAQARRWRWTRGVVTVGVDTERGADGERVTGPNVSVGLPLFDRGDALIDGLGAKLAQARDRAVALEAEIAADAGSSSQQLAAARGLVAAIDGELIPTRQEVVRRLQLEQNYMLTGVFDVLAARQEEFAAQRQRIDALRDYWLARLRVERVMGSGALLPPVKTPEPPATQESPAPPAGHHH